MNKKWNVYDWRANTYLLFLENVMFDVKLQFLISVIDAQLLKTVYLQVLESKHIQHADGQTLHPNSRQNNTVTA